MLLKRSGQVGAERLAAALADPVQATAQFASGRLPMTPGPLPRSPPVTPSTLRRATCRACGGRDLRSIVDLGSTALANSFPQSSADFADEARYPLELFFCAGCSLVQLLD